MKNSCKGNLAPSKKLKTVNQALSILEVTNYNNENDIIKLLYAQRQIRFRALIFNFEKSCFEGYKSAFSLRANIHSLKQISPNIVTVSTTNIEKANSNV